MLRIGPCQKQYVVQHTSRSFCGQIGSHKARDVTAEPAGSGDMQPSPRWVISAGQLRHGPAMHASDCTDSNRGAFSAVHPRASFTRPSSKCSWCRGWLADQANLIITSTIIGCYQTRSPPTILLAWWPGRLRCTSARLHTSILSAMSSMIRSTCLALAECAPKAPSRPRQCQP